MTDHPTAKSRANLLRGACLALLSPAVLLAIFGAGGAQAQQEISSSTSSAVTATGGDFTVDSGVNISISANASAVVVNGVDVPVFTNNGSIYAPTNGGVTLYFNSTDAMASIVNNGSMVSKSGIQLYSPAAISNNGGMTGADRSITIYSGATGTTIVNNGSMGGGYAAITNANGATVASLTNGANGSISSLVPIQNGSTITLLTNYGQIYSTHWVASNAIGGGGTITTLVNYGTISGANGGAAIGEAVGTLANLQGAGGSRLTISNQPGAYDEIVNSPTAFGQLTVQTETAPMSFDIYAGSALRNGFLYTDVLSGVSAVNLSDTSGVFGGVDWSLLLEQGQTSVWDLCIGTGPCSSQLSSNILANTTYALSSVGGATNPVFQGGTLQVDSSGQTVNSGFSLDGSGTNTIDQNGGTATFSGVFSDAVPGTPGSLIIANSGEGGAITFTAANTYSGSTTINSGATLALAGAGSIATSSSVTVNGTLDISGVNASASIANLNGGGSVLLGARTLILTGSPSLFSGVISGSGGVQVSEYLAVLTGTNTYTGGTTINAGGFLGLGNATVAGTVAGNIVDNGRLGMNHSVAFTFGGAISGSGYVTSGGVLSILTGTNTYSGGTFVYGGTLQIGAGGTAGSIVGNVALSVGTSLAFDHSNAVTFNGVVSGAGSLSQIGTGLLILDGVNTYTGLTTVSSGVLEVGDLNHTGARIAGSVLVGAAGTLEGHGTILGALTNTAGGVVSPGGTIGTLTVGSYTQGANSSLAIEVSPTAASLLNVTGAASLNGALKLNFDGGAYTAHIFPVLTAGSISGAFAALSEVGAPAGYATGLTYAPHQVSLVVESTRAGQVFGDIATSTIDQVHSLADLVVDRAGECGAPQARLEGGSGAMSVSAAPGKAGECGPTSVWMQAYGRTDQVDASTTADRFNATDGGVVGGVERRLPGKAAFGAAFAYTHSSLDVGGSAASANADSYFASLYGRGVYHGVELDAEVFYQAADWSTSRAVAGYGSASASPHTNTTGGLFQVSYPVAAGDVHPYLRFSFARLDRGSAVEAGVGALGLTTASGAYDSTRGELGFRFAHTYASRTVTWSPEVRVGVENEFSPTSRDANASLTGVTNTLGFRAPSAEATGAAAVVVGDLKAQLCDRLSLFGDVRGRFASGQTEALVSFGARLSF